MEITGLRRDTASTIEDTRAIALAATAAGRQVFAVGLQGRSNALQKHVWEFVEASDETPGGSGESPLKHMRNFVESMRANKQPNCGIELGCKVQTIVSMAETAYRQKRQVTFDEAKKRLT